MVVKRKRGDTGGTRVSKRVKRGNLRGSRKRGGGLLKNRPLVTDLGRYESTKMGKSKRMPRGLKKFTRLYNKVQDRELVNNLLYRSTNYTATWSAGFQAVASTALYSLSGTSGSWDDLHALAGVFAMGYSSLYPYATATSTLTRAGKFQLASAHCDIIVTNTSTTPTNGQGGENYFLDAYEIVARRDCSEPDAPTAWSNISSSSGAAVIQNSGTRMTSTFLGSSPFDSAEFTSAWKVLGKKSYMIGNGQTIRMSLHDGREKTFDMTKLNIDGGTGTMCSLKGYTKGYIFVCYGDCNANLASTSAGSMCFNFVRRYNVKLPNGFGGYSAATI